MDTFNIIKKNRKYFAATKQGYKCKILIDDNSKDLTIGEHVIDVDDISVRSKYGTDLIYKLSASVVEQEDAGICTLRTPSYNRLLVDDCRQLGGKWDLDERVWIFSGLVADEVEILDEKYNSKLVGVELTALDDLKEYGDGIFIAGFPIAKAYGRDSGATLNDGIAMIKGTVDSGGSRKNWTTVISSGSVLRLMIPELCLTDIDTDVVKVKML